MFTNGACLTTKNSAVVPPTISIATPLLVICLSANLMLAVLPGASLTLAYLPIVISLVTVVGTFVTPMLPEILLENARYLGLMLLAVAAAVAISLPVLLIPLAPAEAGVKANSMYYGVYCGVFATLWAITNWDRLEFFFHKDTSDWESFGHSGILIQHPNPFKPQREYVIALSVAWVAFSATFSLFGLSWGEKMEESLVLFYGAPIAFTFVDCAWFVMVLPRARRSVQAFACVVTLNVLLCAPILLLFVPSFTGELLEDRVAAGWLWVHDLCIPPLIELAFATCLTKVLPRTLRNAGLRGVDVDEATEFHLTCVFEASLLAGIFDDPFRVVGVIFMISAFSTFQRLREAYDDGDPSELRLSWTWHIPGIATPAIYMVHATLIRSYINSDKYFVYRCTAGIDWSEKTRMMLALLLFRLLLLEFEVLYCFVRSHRDTAAVIRRGTEVLQKHWIYVVFCQAFAATLFTSCFFIRHDGLAPLFVGFIEPTNCLEPGNA